MLADVLAGALVVRSTKAGPSGPATRRGGGESVELVQRSTKAGPSGPATPARQRRRPGADVPLNEGRPFRAGNPSRRTPRNSTRTASLNEGRPFRAGNPCPQGVQAHPPQPRSTKAGPSGPATPGRRRGSQPELCERSTKAGPSGPATLSYDASCQGVSLAQRRPALPGRQPVATGRALISVARAQRRPALPGRQPAPMVRSRSTAGAPLNEGRPFRAGNPDPALGSPPQVQGTAQRRPALPGRQPGEVADVGVAGVARSTKAGPSGPATPAAPARRRTAPPTLNEGRPFRAGNPGLCAIRYHRHRITAQRRPALPGRQPRKGRVRATSE